MSWEADEAAVRRMLARAHVIAVVGCSPERWRAGHDIPARMRAAGFRIIPVNPNHAGEDVLGERCHASLSDIPEPVDLVNVFRRPQFVPDVVREAIAIGAPGVFVQQGIVSAEARRLAQEAGIDYVDDRCIAVERAKLQLTR